MWTKFNFEQTALLDIYGMLPGDGVNMNSMKPTFEKVLADWKSGTGRGQDFLLAAMMAVRLHEPDQTINLLLSPFEKNDLDTHGFVEG